MSDPPPVVLVHGVISDAGQIQNEDTGDASQLPDRRSRYRLWMTTAVSEPVAFNLLAVAELARMGPLRMVALLRRSFQDPVEAKLP